MGRFRRQWINISTPSFMTYRFFLCFTILKSTANPGDHFKVTVWVCVAKSNPDLLIEKQKYNHVQVLHWHFRKPRKMSSKNPVSYHSERLLVVQPYSTWNLPKFFPKGLAELPRKIGFKIVTKRASMENGPFSRPLVQQGLDSFGYSKTQGLRQFRAVLSFLIYDI
jgi:hypothetical protein